MVWEEASCPPNLKTQWVTYVWVSRGFQEEGEEGVELVQLQGLVEVVVEEEVQESQHCCLEEVVGTLETEPVGHLQAAILVWS